MDFTFSDDQQLFAESITEFLAKEITPALIRKNWQHDSSSDSQLWQKIVDMGLPAMLVPEAQGGLGLTVLDFVLIAEACGKVALAEPLVEMAMVATPLLASLAESRSDCALLLEKIATGEQRVAISHSLNPVIADADIADYLLLQHGKQLHLVAASDVTIAKQDSVDPSRNLYTVEWDRGSSASMVAEGRESLALQAATLNRGALLNAAQLLGLADAMVGQSVQYSIDREQFGSSIGVNQAIKHHMANCAVQIEFARAPVYRAAYVTSQVPNRADFAVSQAKLAAGDAALLAAKNSIQVHGAMGYTWECDLQIWMKRAWALEKNWGDSGFHKNRVHEWLLNDNALIGAENTFGSQKFSVVADA